MSRTVCSLALLLLLTTTTTSLAAPPSTTLPAPTLSGTLPALDTRIGPNTRLIPGQVLVQAISATTKKTPSTKTTTTPTKAEAERLAAALSRQLGRPLTVQRQVALGWVQLQDVTAVDEARTLRLVDDIKKLEGVAHTAAVWVRRKTATPNDPLFSFMWNLEAIGAPSAWDISQGSSGNVVGVVDTGTVFSHEDLGTKRGREFDFIADSAGANDGNGRDADATDAGDDCRGEGNSFHGTHVAGTILANGNNGVGIAGLNWNATLVTGRSLGRCGGTTVDINEAVLWMGGYQVDGVTPLQANERPRVINLSLGGSGQPCDDYTDQVWNAVTETGTIVVVAAGNDGNNVAVASPANCAASIAVAAFGPTNAGPMGLAPYSNFGPEIAIVAPGGNQQVGSSQNDAYFNGVLSSVDPSISLFQDSAPYAAFEGTSMASPHVAGVISLMLDVNGALDRNGVVEILQSQSSSCSNCQGKPALRADLAVAAAAGTAVTTQPGQSCAGTGFCSTGQVCVNTGTPTCEETCASESECPAGVGCSEVTATLSVCFGPGSGEGEGEGEGELPEGSCDERRGNMDCDVGTGCVDGECERGADGETGTRGLCEFDRDCGSGLCDRGVCTVTCDDDDCADGYSCLDEEDSGVPGGLCVADSCVDDRDICGEGYDCSYSSAKRYVCAVGSSNYAGFCGAAPGASAPLAVLAAMLVRRRRRR